MFKALWSDKYAIPAVLTLAIGIAMCWLGAEMPRSMGWTSAPGLFPILIGASLILLSVALYFEGRQRGAPFIARLGARRGDAALSESSESTVRELLGQHIPAARTMGVVLLYVLVLLKWLPYEIATTLFLALALLANGVRSWRIVVPVSLGASAALSAIFILLLESLLPGPTSLVEQWLYQ